LSDAASRYSDSYTDRIPSSFTASMSIAGRIRTSLLICPADTSFDARWSTASELPV